jgi:hypothetical protein
MPSVLAVVISVLIVVFGSGAMFMIGFAARHSPCSTALSK